eukprot:scaffold825_cov249-Pinguiococcus_pyrenoidosus.AAC.24
MKRKTGAPLAKHMLPLSTRNIRVEGAVLQERLGLEDVHIVNGNLGDVGRFVLFHDESWHRVDAMV